MPLHIVIHLSSKKWRRRCNGNCCLHVRIQMGDPPPPPPPLKNHKIIGFLSKSAPDPLKNYKYQASIQCWAITSMPTKLAGRWWPIYSAIWIPHPSSTKKKSCQSWTPSNKIFWIGTWLVCVVTGWKPNLATSTKISWAGLCNILNHFSANLYCINYSMNAFIIQILTVWPFISQNATYCQSIKWTSNTGPVYDLNWKAAYCAY